MMPLDPVIPVQCLNSILQQKGLVDSLGDAWNWIWNLKQEYYFRVNFEEHAEHTCNTTTEAMKVHHNS